MASVDQRKVVPTRRVHRPTDARVNRVELYFLPVATRIPLKFGSETLTTVTCAVCVSSYWIGTVARPRAGAKRRSAFSGRGQAPCRMSNGTRR